MGVGLHAFLTAVADALSPHPQYRGWLSLISYSTPDLSQGHPVEVHGKERRSEWTFWTWDSQLEVLY